MYAAYALTAHRKALLCVGEQGSLYIRNHWHGNETLFILTFSNLKMIFDFPNAIVLIIAYCSHSFICTYMYINVTMCISVTAFYFYEGWGEWGATLDLEL